MDKLIDTRFERVERALASLIDSISKYSPSTTQAGELAAADKELSDGLSQLQTHQNNHARIQKLRQETADLDAQIKNTISVLWTTRKEITATPTTNFPTKGPKYQFTYSELLDYARFISPTTLPSPGITNGVDLSVPLPTTTAAPGSQADDAAATADASRVQTPAGGTTASASAAATPVATTGSGAGGAANNVEGATSQAAESSQVSAVPSLPDHLNPAAKPAEGSTFYPWPEEVQIRGGALATNQQLRAAGIEPRGHDPVEEERRAAAAAEQERKEAEERQRLQREEHERRGREELERIARERARVARERENEDTWRRGSTAAPAPGGGGGAAGAGASAAPGEKKQFQFMGDLDDDDD